MPMTPIPEILRKELAKSRKLFKEVGKELREDDSRTPEQDWAMRSTETFYTYHGSRIIEIKELIATVNTIREWLAENLTENDIQKYGVENFLKEYDL